MAEITNTLADGVRKAFLAGVGAVALGTEKAGEFVDELVKRGELTVEQGKDLNRELTHKAKAAASDAQDTLLKARMQAMTAEERAQFVERAQRLASDLDAAQAQNAEPVVVEVEDAADEAQE